MDPRVKELRLMRWKEIVVACNNSGMKKKEWMELNHINSKSFYRMQKEIREYELEKMELPRLSEAGSALPAPQFVDISALAEAKRSCGQKSSFNPQPEEALRPELMIQAGRYKLYVGSGISEATLSTVMKVIARA